MKSLLRRARCLTLVVLALFLVLPVSADPPAEPQLRLEAGMHTAVIRRITADAQGRWAVTAGYDKTARVWDVATGRLLSVLRPPIGPGFEGQLRAAALSPDGATVAVAGWTGWGWDGRASVYLFARDTGVLTRRLSNLPSVVCELRFSIDGRWLAATVAGNGVRVWDLTHPEVAPLDDPGFLEQGYGLAFSSDGRLAATGYDGKLRVYQIRASGLNKQWEVPVSGGKLLYGVSFRPDGRQLVVGIEDSMAVEVFDASSGALLRSLPVPVGPGNLLSVLWNSEGIWAGGTSVVADQRIVRHWSGDGNWLGDIPCTNNTILGLTSLPGGRLLVAGTDPAWGVIGAQGYESRGASTLADFRDQQFVLGASDRGTVLRFGFLPWGKSPWSFDWTRRDLTPAPGSGDVAVADTVSLAVDGWKYTSQPTLGGKALSLEKYEISRSLAVAPGGDRFVLGADWNLYGFDRQGQQLWKVAAPGVVWAVTIPRKGQVAVAAYGDGTLRWHRLSDGQELLALFPHADQKRWVAWTPSGYYDASPGGEELIGWHVNRGADRAADFYPASRFRDRFYRPDILDQVLVSLDESLAVQIADAARGVRVQAAAVAQSLPPVVDLPGGADLVTDRTEVTLRYRVRTASDAPVTGVRARVNGQTAEVRGLPATGANADERTVTVVVPAADCEVQLFAESRLGTSSPAVVRVKWTGKKDEFVIKPKLYVLAVGVGAYRHPDIPKLNLSAKDARDFAATLKAQGGKLYRDVEVKLLTDGEATRDDVVDGLDWLQKQVTQHDVGMLFLSGHGLNDPSLGYVYLPVNADPEKIKRTGVPMTEIQTTLASLVGKAVVFLDTCHSGNVLGAGRKAVGNDINAVVNELSSAENGVVVFSSSTGRQYSLEAPEWGNGAFTKALIEGLNGKADYQGQGRITFKMLDLYVSERVKGLTKGQQSPVTQAPGGVPDFPLAAVK